MARFAALAAITSLVLAIGLGAIATAEESVDAAGWWTRRTGAESLPEGGIEVALGADGEESVAAVRIAVPAEGFADARLELEEAESTAVLDAALRACLEPTPFEPANPGAWNERPTSPCSSVIAVERTDDGRWVVDLTSALEPSARSLSLLLVPDIPAGSLGALRAPFRLTFASVTLVATPNHADADPGPAEAAVASTSTTAAPSVASDSVPVRPGPAPLPVTTTLVGVEVDASGGSEQAVAPTQVRRLAVDTTRLWTPWLTVAVLLPVLGMIVSRSVNARPAALGPLAATGPALVLAGVIGIALGWRGAAGTLAVPLQWPWIVSGGLGGAALVVLGISVIDARHQRLEGAAERARLDEILRGVA